MEHYTSLRQALIVLLSNELDRTPMFPKEKTMLWHQRLGQIGEKGFQTLHAKGMAKGISNCPQILISMNIVYMVNKIG